MTFDACKTGVTGGRKAEAEAARPVGGASARTAAVLLESLLTCPECGHAKRELMPTDACQFFYECEQCKAVLSPKAGDCCVFCSYGTVKCPPVQRLGACSSCGV